MKKSLLFLFIISLSINLYSAIGSSSSSDISKGLSANTTVTFDPRNINDVNIGFSRNEIRTYDDEVERIIDGSTEDLTVGDGGIEDKSIYVYWKIRSTSKVSASLSILSSLKGKDGEIDWSIGLKDGSASISSKEMEEELSIVNGSETFGTVGSSEVIIRTENINNQALVPGDYIGDLRLNIAIE